MVKTEAPLELQPIEQLAQRVHSLVEVLGTTRDELKLALDDNTRLSGEVEELRAKLQAAADEQEARAQDLQAEREAIRDRVTRMLDQIEEISL